MPTLPPEPILFLTVFAGMFYSRVVGAASQGKVAFKPEPAEALWGIGAILSMLAALIWGFVHLHWAYPLLAFLVAALLSAFVARGALLATALLWRNPSAALSVAGAVFLWAFQGG